MAKNRVNVGRAAAADWTTPAARVAWLVESRYGGNRSAFAHAIQLSHTAINKVVSGRPPGRRLLTAIVTRLRVSPAWLLTGVGQPFLEPAALGDRVGLPVVQTLLPGPPVEHQDLLSGGWIDVSQGLFAPSQYWLLLTSAQPIVRDPARGFKVGDQLLIETDRARFPKPGQLLGRLCVVRFPGGDPPLKLGAVSHHAADVDTGPERLEVDTFDLALDPSRLIREEVYRHYPHGEIRHAQRCHKIVESRGRKLAVPLGERDVEPALPRIDYTDIVAVWLHILRRPRPVDL